jgi:hypothetical protein
MHVVADASPLRYLILIGHIDLLPAVILHALSTLRYPSGQNASSRTCVIVQGQCCGRAVTESPVSSRALARA